MDCGNASSQIRIFNFFKTGVTHQRYQSLLIRKARDRTRQILVSALRSTYNATYEREYAMKVELEEASKTGNYGLRKLEHDNAAAIPDDSK